MFLAADQVDFLVADVSKDLDVTSTLQQEAGRRIVYAEEFSTAVEAHARVAEIAALGEDACRKLVTANNPEWKDWMRRFVYAGSSDAPEGDAGGVGAKTPKPTPPLQGANAVKIETH